jgi:iron complex outermembrane receptor protein
MMIRTGIRRAGILAAALWLGAPGRACGQGTGDVVGKAVASGTGDPVVSAMVEVVETGMRMPTDVLGRFHLARLRAGPVAVRVSAIGFTAVDTTVTVRQGESTSLTVALRVEPIQVPGIEVSVLRPDLRRQSQMEQQAVREANPRDPGELLREVSGVDAARRGALGLDPSVQGLMETQVASFVDGERRFPAGPARMDAPLTHVDALAYRKLQVVKGPYALTWGAGSLSAIRADTEPLPPERAGALHGSLTAGYDSNVNGAETSAGLVGRSGDLSYWGFGAYRQGEDYKDGDGNLVQGNYKSWEARGKVGFQLAPRSNLVLAGGYQDQGPIDYPGRILDADYFRTWNGSAEYSLSGRDGTFRGLDVNAYYNTVDHGMNNQNKPSAAMLKVLLETSTRVAGGRAAALFRAEGWELAAGGDVYSANRDADREIRNAMTDMVMVADVVWPDVTTNAGGVFLRGDRAFSGVLDFSATARLDLAGSKAGRPSDWFVDNVSARTSTSSTDLSGAATLGMHLSRNWMLFAGAGSAVRTPDANELYADRFPASKAQLSAEFVGNPDLEPERSTQFDLGFDGSYSIVNLQGNAFVRNIADHITLEPTDLEKKLPMSPDVVYQYVNGDAFYWGIEAAAGVLLARSWTLNLRTDYLWGEDRTLDEPAFAVMPWRGSAGLRYDMPNGRFHGDAILKLAGRQERVSATRGETPTDGWVTGDLRFGWKVTDLVLLRFGIQNVGDRQVVNHLNSKDPFTGEQIAEPGRILYVNLGFSF